MMAELRNVILLQTQNIKWSKFTQHVTVKILMQSPQGQVLITRKYPSRFGSQFEIVTFGEINPRNPKLTLWTLESDIL